jgi:hypothetical protein
MDFPFSLSGYFPLKTTPSPSSLPDPAEAAEAEESFVEPPPEADDGISRAPFPSRSKTMLMCFSTISTSLGIWDK